MAIEGVTAPVLTSVFPSVEAKVEARIQNASRPPSETPSDSPNFARTSNSIDNAVPDRAAAQAGNTGVDATAPQVVLESSASTGSTPGESSDGGGSAGPGSLVDITV
ncbi:MAG: hypothetical protein QGG17_05515 [Rhodospirillales bacterium]|jgi:hypothetical protein|nr:hypothetical protein [Rhodospirillales bacterium]